MESNNNNNTNELYQAALASDVPHQLQLQATAAVVAANLSVEHNDARMLPMDVAMPTFVDAGAFSVALTHGTMNRKLDAGTFSAALTNDTIERKPIAGAKRKIETDGSNSEQPPTKRRYTFLDPSLITRAELLVKEQQWAVAAAARHLKVSAGTLYKHFQRAQAARPASTKRKGRPQVLSPEEEAIVRSWSEKDKKLSYSKLAALVTTNLNKSVSPGTIGRVLKEGQPHDTEAVVKFVDCMHMAKKKLDVCAALMEIPAIVNALIVAHESSEVTVRVLAESQEAWDTEPQFQPLKDAGIAVYIVRPAPQTEEDNMYCVVDKQIRVTLQQMRRRRQPLVVDGVPSGMMMTPLSEPDSIE